MKFRHLFIAAVSALAAVVACDQEKPILGITVAPTDLSFTQAGGSATVQVTVDGSADWAASVPSDAKEWLSVTGNGSTATVKVLENTGTPRKAVVKISALYFTEYLTVSQEGPVAAGDGKTYETAFTASEMVAYIKANVASGAEDGPFYVKGVISEVKTTFEASGSYGNAVFYMSDTGDRGSDDFYVFQTYYLGNRQWKSGDTDIKVGDQVVVYGKVTNYAGNTPETVGKGGSFVYELNGVSDGGTGGGGDNPSEVEQLTCAEFIAKADPSTTYRLVGTVTSAVNTTYCSFDMNDGTATVVVWTVNNKDEWKDVVKQGGTVTVRGKYTLYTAPNGTTKHEMIDAYIEKFEEGSAQTGTAKGTGTLDDPYNPAGAAAYAESLGADVQSPGSVYIKGKISTVSTTFEASGTFGNANFYIVDSEDGSGSFYIFQTYYLGNRKWSAGDTDVKAGDEVIVYGPVINYQGKTPETAGKGASYIYSLNGTTDGGDPAPSFGVASTSVSVGASATSATVKVTGNVDWTATSPDASVSPETGTGAGDITVSFDPNTDTENAKTYTVVVSTTADVATQSFTVTVTQAKASAGGGGEVTFALDNTVTWTAETDATYKGGYTTTQEGIKVGFYQHSSTSTPVAPDQYSIRIYKSSVFIVNAPEGKTLTSITMTANNLNNGQYCKDLTVLEGGSGTVTADASTMQIGPWTGSAGKVVFQAAAAQVRLVSITVTYE